MQQYGLYPFELVRPFPEHHDLVSEFHPPLDVRRKQFEILIENGLRRNRKFHSVGTLLTERNFQENSPIPLSFAEKRLIFIHIGRIQPYQGRRRESVQQGPPSGLFRNAAYYIGIDISLVAFLYRKLGVAVENVDFFYFISEEGYPVGLLHGK